MTTHRFQTPSLYTTSSYFSNVLKNIKRFTLCYRYVYSVAYDLFIDTYQQQRVADTLHGAWTRASLF